MSPPATKINPKKKAKINAAKSSVAQKLKAMLTQRASSQQPASSKQGSYKQQGM
jgi:hypothetical protein